MGQLKSKQKSITYGVDESYNMNDLLSATREGKIVLYADDTILLLQQQSFLIKSSNC